MIMLVQTIGRLRPIFQFLTTPTRFQGDRLFIGLAIAATGMSVLFLGMLTLDDRIFVDESVWLKPFKFAVSFAVLFGTLAFASERLLDAMRRSLFIFILAVATAAAFAFEMAYISSQAARQEESHFTESSDFHERMYSLMGLGATTVMTAVAVVGLIALIDRTAPLKQGLRLGIGLGFLMTTVLTLWVAGDLAENGRFIGVPDTDHARLPLLGWSMEVGDLRPAHFLSLHAMQVIPFLGFLADKMGLSLRAIWAVAALYAGLTVVVLLQALQGVPLITATLN